MKDRSFRDDTKLRGRIEAEVGVIRRDELRGEKCVVVVLDVVKK